MNESVNLTTNTKAPHFSLKDVFGRIIDLNDYADKRILLAFFRHAGCPFCNLRVHALQKEHETFKKQGLEMIFFFESKEQVILRSSFHKGVSPVPIISDPEKKWYGVYGLEESGYKSTMSHITSFVQTTIKAKLKSLPVHMMAGGESMKTIPAEFLIDKELVLKKLHYSQHLNDRLDIEEIMAFAKTGKVLNPM